MKLNLKNITFILLITVMYSCIETLEYKTITYESALAVEARITNETKLQKVKLTRVYKLEDENTTNETGAIVTVTDDQGKIFNFNEFSPGEYISNTPFAALQNVKYQLHIKTNDQKTYTSNQQEIKGISSLQNVKAKAVTSNIGGIPQEGISIIAESFDPTRNSTFYRYEFEETNKIIAPYWSPNYIKIIRRESRPIIEIVRKNYEDRICYKTEFSNNIIITETTNLTEDRVSIPVNFIQKNDVKIRFRYSILVRQYVQTPEAYNYYKLLEKLSTSENLLSPVQPGILIGNVFSNENENEDVLGFFEVASVSSKRLFFNFSDFYDKGLTGIYNYCKFYKAPILWDHWGEYSPLIDLLDKGEYMYFAPNEPSDFRPGNHLFVLKECGDCTVYGSNIKPTFWID